jgi:hypothetical protein
MSITDQAHRLPTDRQHPVGPDTVYYGYGLSQLADRLNGVSGQVVLDLLFKVAESESDVNGQFHGRKITPLTK